MNNKEKYEIVKEVSKELRKKFKEFTAMSYGYCCRSDYFAYKDVKDDYMCCQLYRGGMNNKWDAYLKEFDIGDYVNYFWGTELYSIFEIVNVMQNIVSKYGCVVEIPMNENGEVNYNKCVKLTFVKEN